jgi:hypothetical protein
VRFMLQIRADRNSEAGIMPSAELVAAMGKFNEEMIAAKIMLAGEGLHPSSKGARVAFAAGGPKVLEPPFAEPDELIAGFWILDVKSKQEAIDWARRAPFPPGAIVEIRQIFEASDFPADILPADAAAREQAWRDEQQQKARPRAS